MLKAEEQMELVVLKKHGDSIRGLSRSTGRSRNTVRRYLRGGEEVAKRKPGPKRAEKLDPFKTYIVDRMKAALPDRIPATVLFREIKGRGYEGGETRVKLFVRGLTPEPAATPAVRFETEPGRQPAERLVIEQAALQAVPAPYRDRSARSLIAPVHKTVVGYQHPLAVYEDLMPGGVA